MKWLAIDTSTSALAIGVIDKEKVWGEMLTDLKRHHSERLLPSIQQLLQEAHIPLTDIGGIAVSRGPGSYTGVRIGVMTAKTLAWSLEIPLVGVSSLAALAVNGQRFSGLLVPMWDARRERVYTGLYQADGETVLTRLQHDQVVSVIEWVEKLAGERGPFFFLGDGALQYRALIQSHLSGKALFATGAENVVHAHAVAHLAMKKYEGAGPDRVDDFAPEYLQVTEAEAKWDKQNRMNSLRK